MRLQVPVSPVQLLLRKMVAAGLQAADPYRAVLRTVSLVDRIFHVGRKVYNLDEYDRVLAVGAGKASARMAQALEHICKRQLQGGLVVVPTGQRRGTKRINIAEAGHPIPDRAGVVATRQLEEMLNDLTAHDLVIVLLSGGASSLLPSPVPGVSLADKQKTTRLLLTSGAPIQDINVVRKHLSRLKGGGLAASTKATIITLILSDVIGDDLGSIGSGPTAPDPSTFADAIAVLKRYTIWDDVPKSVRAYLVQGRRGMAPETSKPGSKRLRSIQNTIIGNNSEMLAAAAKVSRTAGIRTVLSRTALTGEAQNAAR